MSNLKNTRVRTTFSRPIAIPSLTLIIGLSLFCGVFPKKSEAFLATIKGAIFDNLSWFYVMSVTVFVLFLVFLALSKYGKVKLGTNDDEPEYTFGSWIAMLFAAGMGIGLMYFGVAEPMTHFNEQIGEVAGTTQRAKDAQLYTFFHWGVHAWAIYGVVGLALAYFAYRYKQPLSMRSALYPMLKDKINGPAGHIIDVFALCSTFFGIATTLGFGVVQLNAGLLKVGLVSSASFYQQIAIVCVVMTIAIISTLTGLSKGVKLLSNINIISATLLMLFVLVCGPTVFILSSFSEGIGYYLSSFTSLTFTTYAFESDLQGWFTGWTVLYWAWWISWSPYVGLFIAKISKGRTIREFIVAVLLIPTAFNFLWMTTFGNGAIWTDIFKANGSLSQIVNSPDTLLFEFFSYLPLSSIISFLAIFIISIFFITSADSGIYIMNNIASQNGVNPPKWQKIFWGALLGILSLTLLKLGGLGALQTMTLISALPFAVIMLIFCYNLLKALSVDDQYYSTKFSHATTGWSGDRWRELLGRIISYPQRKDVKNYINTTVKSAFVEVIGELEKHNIKASLKHVSEPEVSIEIEIAYSDVMNFTYGVEAQLLPVSESLINDENSPKIRAGEAFIPVTFFGDGRKGYDIQYFTKEEVIVDVLKQYERFLSIVSDDTNDLFVKK